MRSDTLLLGIDGGGTRCRARLCSPSGAVLGESAAGPANIRLGLETSFAAILQSTKGCLAQAGLSTQDMSRVTACLGLAGASEPADLAGAKRWKQPFRQDAFAQFDHNPHRIADWASRASPGEFGTLAPLATSHARSGDRVAVELMRSAAFHVDTLADRLVQLGARRIALMGGLSEHLRPWLSQATVSHLVQPAGDALDGALQVVRAAAESAAA